MGKAQKHFGDVAMSCICHPIMISCFPCPRILIVYIGGPEYIKKKNLHPKEPWKGNFMRIKVLGPLQ